eukprot:CAMPEP_0183325064 /NCGR_PEP_ID=MMETSP0160_2-20130417/78698_1 /TAXON_ID=2839 ORGANISM="Odontella Sinensis, Strain Grunow 1884" /NCGR_SAMPLE_ID=MMETSP0160_2 /ASSEMBLY_ACC=CAM_ASM_000250 /LENGTH=200 /DNA_ID=CAMNT_0025492785 /DNA_START=41 /DNA_END=644 /DNA_ORIENTATION=+
MEPTPTPRPTRKPTRKPRTDRPTPTPTPEDEWGGGGGGDEWDEWSMPVPAPTRRPTAKYVPPPDEEEMPTVPYTPTMGEGGGEEEGGAYGSGSTASQFGSESNEELVRDLRVQIVAGVLVALGLVGMLVVAHQTMNNPDDFVLGVVASASAASVVSFASSVSLAGTCAVVRQTARGGHKCYQITTWSSRNFNIAKMKLAT